MRCWVALHISQLQDQVTDIFSLRRVITTSSGCDAAVSILSKMQWLTQLRWKNKACNDKATRHEKHPKGKGCNWISMIGSNWLQHLPVLQKLSHPALLPCNDAMRSQFSYASRKLPSELLRLGLPWNFQKAKPSYLSKKIIRKAIVKVT